jgi:hypothetical protein
MARLLSFLSLLMFPLFFYGQNRPETALRQLDENYASEKIHLFFNKEEYVSGETMWFKAYCFSGYVLSYISTNLYVELYNEEKLLIDKMHVPLLNGVGQGSFNLQQTLPEGVYFIRAYTRWMLNFGEAFQYIQSFPVYNASSAKKLSPKKLNWAADVFPESGKLLIGEENKIAVRLKTNGKLPESWKGHVAEKTTPTRALVQFSSLNPELSSFYFTPDAGKEYVVYLEDNFGNNSSLDLRPVKDGVLLKAEQLGDLVSVEMVFKGTAGGGMGHKLLAHMQHMVVYSGVIRNNSEVIKISLPVKKLMNGIMHLTVFDDKENAIAERLVFINVDKSEPPVVQVNNLQLKPRALNDWKLLADTAQYLHYAYSVTDASFTGARKRSILSDLWLGDLTSEIHDPSWYFTSADPNRLPALDALLLSERWQRFDWKNIMDGQFPVLQFKPENYLSYTATANRNKKPVSEETLNLILKFKDSSVQFTQVKTDKQGKFLIKDVAFFDTVMVYYQGNSKKNTIKDVDIVFESANNFIPFKGRLPSTEYTMETRKSSDVLPPVLVNEMRSVENQGKLDNRYIQMDEVRVEAKMKSATKQLNDKLTSGLFNVPNETVFDFVNQDQGLLAYTNIFDWLEGRVAGLNFTIGNESQVDGTGASLSSAGQRVPVMRDGNVPVFIDEMPADMDMVYSLNISDIAMVKVLKGYFLGASGAGGSGAIAIYLKRGNLKRDSVAALPTGILAGYRQPGNYITLDHADEFIRTAVTKDTRVQLLWSADVIPDKEGKVPVRFYNNDAATSFRMVITGFTKDAKPVFVEKIVGGD